MRNEYRIRLQNSEQAEDFVRLAGTYDFDIDLLYNKIIVDAKSILGVLSLDLSNILTVKCNVKDESFENEIKKYSVIQ